MTQVDADVAIIGLGPAGASAACHAAKCARVIAIDRKKIAGEPVQCAEFVSGLIGSSVSNVARSCIQDIASMVTFVENGNGDVTPDFRGKMIDRARFDADLCRAAEEAGAECRFGVRLDAIDANGVLRLSSGDKIRARIIIGCDGPRSAAGRAIGSVNAEVVETRQARVRLLGSHEATDIFLSNDIPGGYAWLFPKGAFANVGVGVDADKKALLKPCLEKLISRLVGEGRIGSEPLSYTGGAIPVGGLLRAHGHIGVTPVLLAGDAAGLANPITGAGIAAATISGEMAAECSLAALSGEQGFGEKYQEELEDLFGGALRRALRRRRRLSAIAVQQGALCDADLRSGWIAYQEYWAA